MLLSLHPRLGSGALPILDRDAELDTLQRAVEEVAEGDGRIVLIEGGAGAGKTRLLAEARSLSEQAGLRVLSARGDQTEHEYPHGVVRQLFEAALLSAEGGQWLTGHAGGAGTVFTGEASVEAPAFATLNSLYWMTVNAAAAGPLALIVDDLHWADRPSLAFLQFVARRLSGLPLLLLVASRPAAEEELADITASSAAIVTRPAPLTHDAVGALTEHILGVWPAERFVNACEHATGGNPLLLVELLRALRAKSIVPDDAHVDAIDHLGPPAVSRIVGLRLRRLGGDAPAVAQAIATLGSGAAPSLVAALAEVQERGVAEAMASLRAAEIINGAQGPIAFVHPIVRDAIYRDLMPHERERRHARAAELLHARAAAPGQVGAHLMLTAPRGLGWVEHALEDAAADAARRGAAKTAVALLRRAVAERPAQANADLLYRLGMAESAIDPGSAVDHLRAARDATADGGTQARMGEMIARMLIFTDPSEGVAVARETARELPPGADDLRAGLLALERHAGRFLGAVGEPYPEATPDTPRGRMLAAVRARDLALSGATAQECARVAASVLGLDEPPRTRPVPGDTMFTAVVASSVLMLADDRRAQDVWDTWSAGRAQSTIAGGIWHGSMYFRLGRLRDAEAAIRGVGLEVVPAQALAKLADTLVERGDLEAARAALDLIPDGLSEGALLGRCAALRLLLAQGRHQELLDAAEPVLDRLRTVLNPAWAPWRSACAEALARVGRGDEAIALASEELELARRWGTPGPIATALTVLGALQGSVETLEEAVEVTRDDAFARLEHAKALLALGRAVRQRRRPRDARAYLRDAHGLAIWCGAGSLARDARQELAAAGGRPRAIEGSGAGSLTPSERRVAELAASGRRNRDIAEQLYLSLKTVEVHLSNSYRKLGIRSRAELATVLEPSTAPALAAGAQS